MSSSIMPYISPRLLEIKTRFEENETSPIFLSHSLESYLRKLKDQINEHLKVWDVYKKYTNPYESIHSAFSGTQPVCQLKPISRSYFKMIEIINMFELTKTLPCDKMSSFHLAEGPGGFIEALSQVRNNSNDIYVGMTLLSEDNNVPGWRKSQSFLDKNPNVHIEYGDDMTGNIMVERNLMRCSRLYGATMDLVTADGGFDFSGDFNAQETKMGGLLYSQVVFASALQKQGGTFILKMFDTFSLLSVQILYLLSVMYEKVYIVKPNTSRYANSERYVVAQGFRSSDGRKEWTIQFLQDYEKVQTHNIYSIFSTEIPSLYLTRVEECNAALGQQQMDTIAATLTLIRNPRQEKIEKMRSLNIQKCVIWCQRNKVPYNRDVRQLNMFLSARNKVSRVPKKSPPIEPSETCLEQEKLLDSETDTENIESQQS